MQLNSTTHTIPKKYEELDIFNRFSFLIEDSSCLDLSNGGCTIPPSPVVVKALQDTALDTFGHQYAPNQGYFPLLSAISEYCSYELERKLNPLSNVLVSAGATGCISEILLTFIKPDDEVIVIEPYYSTYEDLILQVNGVMVTVCMDMSSNSVSEWKINTELLRKAFSPKTKLVLINSPHNPSGKVFTREELQVIADLCIEFDVLCLSDAVYNGLIYDKNAVMFHIATLPGMWERTITIMSAGKVFGIAGWRLGWSIGPYEIIAMLIKAHTNFIFHIPTSIQKAITSCLLEEIAAKEANKCGIIKSFANELLKNRDRLVPALRRIGLNPIIPSSGVFMFIDFSHSNVSNETGEEICYWLMKEYNLGCLPGICFFTKQNYNSRSKNFMRLCFARHETFIDQVVTNLTNSN